ncbi:MFS transporter [uncultured Maritalea sp.]|uniref:MFS transporter n=1 Tax=uncultured Maritalea sp. TaxID=757249 RepID=UPI00261294B3|nr:MFS transporter [uncultured Maritalea sp.]
MSTQDENAHVKFSDLFKEGRALLTLTLILSVGSHATNLFVTRTVLPTIVADIGGKELMYWALALFQIAAIVGGMGSAQIKDKLGGRHTIYLAAALLVVGSCFAGFAQHFGYLVLGRGIQGFAEGLLISLSYIILSESYPNNLMARMIGMLAVVWAAASAIGPLAAGLLESSFGWRSAFLVNLVIAILLVVQSRYAVKQQPSQKDGQRIPIARLALFVSAITGICLTGQFTNPVLILAILAFSMALLAFAIKRDKRAKNRMLPNQILTTKGTIGLGIWTNISISIAVGGHGVYGVALLQSIWQLSPIYAGFLASIVAAAWSVASWGLSGVAKLKNQLLLIRTGITMITFSFPITALAWSLTNLTIATLGFAILGLGLGTSTIFLEKKIMHAATHKEKDRTSSILPPIDSAAGAIGAAFASILALSLGLFGGTPTFGILDAHVASVAATQMYLTFFALSVPAMVMSFLLPLDDSQSERTNNTQPIAE